MLLSISLFLAGKAPHVRGVLPICQFIACIVFVVAGLSDLRPGRASAFQPLEIEDAGKGVRLVIALTEILCGLALFVPPLSPIAAGVLLGLCVGSVALDPPLIRRSPTLPLLCIVLLVIAYSNWHYLDYWHSNTFNDLFQGDAN